MKVLMIMTMPMAVDAGKVVPSTGRRSICCLWILRGHPDLLAASSHFITPTDGCGDFIIKIFPLLNLFSYCESLRTDSLAGE